MSSKNAAAKTTKEIYSRILQNSRIVSRTTAKTPYQLERHLKGVANHTRISILLLVAKEEGITLDQITQSLEANFKTISEHTKKLTQAGLIEKRYVGNFVAHVLTPYGKKINVFLQSF